MCKNVKNCKKRLNKQFPDVRDRRYGRDVINGIVKNFQDIESFTAIHMKSENERRHYTSFLKIKIMTSNEVQWISCKSLHLELYDDAHRT